MSYISLLKEDNKILVINGIDGCGKSTLSNQLAKDEVSVVISSSELYGSFTHWLKVKPSVVVIDVESSDTLMVFDKVKRFISHDKIEINIRCQELQLMDTPFFILNTNCKESQLKNARRLTVINIEKRGGQNV